MEKQNFLVLQAKRYDFKSQGGDQLKGCTVHYIDPNGEKDESNAVGFTVAKQNLPYERFEDFANGAGIYEVSFKAVLQGRGMQLIPDGFKFLRPIVFEDPVKK